MTNSPEMRALDPARVKAVAYEISSYLGERPDNVDNGGCARWETWKPLAASILSLPVLSAPHAQGDVAGLVAGWTTPEDMERLRQGKVATVYGTAGGKNEVPLYAHSDGAVAEPVAWQLVAAQKAKAEPYVDDGEDYPVVARARILCDAVLTAASYRDAYLAVERLLSSASPINPVPAGVGYRYRIKTTEFPKWSGWASAESDPHDWLWLDNWTDMQVEETLRQATDAERGAGE